MRVDSTHIQYPGTILLTDASSARIALSSRNWELHYEYISEHEGHWIGH